MITAHYRSIVIDVLLVLLFLTIFDFRFVVGVSTQSQNNHVETANNNVDTTIAQQIETPLSLSQISQAQCTSLVSSSVGALLGWDSTQADFVEMFR